MYVQPQPLADKVALVTGGGRGIGAGICLELAKQGAKIAINYSESATAAEEVAAIVQKLGPKAAIFQADLRRIPQVRLLFEHIIRYFGRLDIVVSNAGVEKFCSLEDTSLEDYNMVFDLNTRAQFFVARFAYDYIQPGGRVILTSSIAAGIAVEDHALYAGSKSAVEGFTRCLSADFGRKNCTVNAIAPAGVKTDMWMANSWRYANIGGQATTVQEIEKILAEGSPLQRCGVPEDIARVVAFLVSPAGEWVNGQIIHVNGGARV